MLKGSVALVNFKGERSPLNCLKGDIVSFEEGDQHYRVKLRGSSKVVRVKAFNLAKLEGSLKADEDARLALLEEWSKSDANYLRERVLALELCDEFKYIVESNTDPRGLDPLPEAAASKALVRYVEAFYVGNAPIFNEEVSSLTSYHKALVPFYTERGAGCFEVDLGRTSGEVFENLQPIFSNSVLDSTGERDEIVFFRAFAFARHRLNTGGDSLLDAFCVTFYSIQLLQGKIPPMDAANVGSAASLERVIRTFGRTGLTSSQLLWCFCILFLQIGIVVRDKIPDPSFNLIFPDPFGTTIVEQIIIAELVTMLRPNCPKGYLSAYTMTMDVKDLMATHGEGNEGIIQWMQIAYNFAVNGLEVADEVGDPFYQYIFHVIVAYWLPTSAHAPKTYSFGEMKSRIRRAKEFKVACEAYVPEISFFSGVHHERATKQVFKTFNKLSDDDQLSAPLMDSYLYSSVRFDTTYYRPGGKFDSLSERFQCANCSRQVVRRLICARCEKAVYCNQDCQREHWRASHKAECKHKKKKGDQHRESNNQEIVGLARGVAHLST